MDGKIKIDDPITHAMPLERINDAFDLMHRGESIRSVVVYWIGDIRPNSGPVESEHSGAIHGLHFL
jgi:hypothetical protein